MDDAEICMNICTEILISLQLILCFINTVSLWRGWFPTKTTSTKEAYLTDKQWRAVGIREGLAQLAQENVCRNWFNQ